MDVTPSLEKRFSAIWGYTKPKLGFRAIGYNLDNVAVGEESNPGVALPIFSWDNGLFFERLTKWQGRSFINTLEPRIFYVYIPREKYTTEIRHRVEIAT